MLIISARSPQISEKYAAVRARATARALGIHWAPQRRRIGLHECPLSCMPPSSQFGFDPFAEDDGFDPLAGYGVCAVCLSPAGVLLSASIRLLCQSMGWGGVSWSSGDPVAQWAHPAAAFGEWCASPG